MSRRNRSANEATVSLFPFLAVLICTMGSLIVLLVVVVQQAKGQAEREADATLADAAAALQAKQVEPARPLRTGPTEAEVEAAEAQREQLLWQIEQMQLARQQTLEAVRTQRDELSHIEDHTRRLQARVDELREEAKRMAALQADRSESLDASDSELVRLRATLAAARSELENRRQQMASHRASHIIVPYDGRGGTHRQPIFIECVEDRVIIQPEGIALSAADFLDTSDVNNPLAVALRAVREYNARTMPDGEDEPPYPLLIVRPGGSIAFAACRHALDGWDDEFGYELVDDDIELTFPASDPELERTLQLAVDASRRQQAIRRGLVAARRDDATASGYRASRTGGFVAERSAGGRDSGPSTAPTYSGSVSRLSRQPAGQTLPQDNDIAATDAVRASEWSGGELDDQERGPADSAADLAGSPAGFATANPGSAMPASSASPKPNDSDRDKPSSEYTAGMQPGSNAATSSSNVSNPNAEGGSGGRAARGTPPPIATRLGNEWAVRNASDNGIPITRPIPITISRGKVIIGAERRGQSATVLEVESTTEAIVDPLVQTIRGRIHSWGTAGATMYWQPTLEVSVTPDGEERYTEFEALMRGSGLEWTRIR